MSVPSTVRVMAVWLLVSLVAVYPASAQQSETVAGSVTELPEGVPLTSAFVLVHAFGGKNDVVAQIDRNGQFSVTLDPGLYYIFAAASGFLPQCRSLKVVSGKHYRADFKLHFDSENAQE